MSAKLLYIPFSGINLSVHEVVAPVIMTDELRTMIRQVDAQYRATNSPTTLRALNGRLERGLEIALRGDVHIDPAHPDHCQVRSSNGFEFYEVNLDTKTCTCPDSQKGFHCKHRIAAFFFTQALRLLNQKQVRQSPTSPQPDPQPASKTLLAEREAQILKELGFDSVPAPITRPSVAGPDGRLGSLYRRYLHGEDLDGKPHIVEIADITQEVVSPHPSQPSHPKWCLWVKGLPTALPKGILFGVVGEQDLVTIFGQVDLSMLRGKSIVIYPQPMVVGGQPRVAIRFRSAQ